MKYYCHCEASSAEDCAEKYPGEQPRSMQRMPRQALTLRQPCKPESLASPRHTHVCDRVGRLPSCSDPAHVAGAMTSGPVLCKDVHPSYAPTCEEDAGHVDWFASKCCGNGLSRCHGDRVGCECWLRCVWGLAWSLRACGACACWVWTHATWPDPRVVWLQLRSRRCAWSLPRSCPTTHFITRATRTTRRTLRSRPIAPTSVGEAVTTSMGP